METVHPKFQDGRVFIQFLFRRGVSIASKMHFVVGFLQFVALDVNINMNLLLIHDLLFSSVQIISNMEWRPNGLGVPA